MIDLPVYSENKTRCKNTVPVLQINNRQTEKTSVKAAKGKKSELTRNGYIPIGTRRAISVWLWKKKKAVVCTVARCEKLLNSFLPITTVLTTIN